MTYLLLAAMLAAVPCPNAPRSAKTVAEFKKFNPCPFTCKTYIRQGSKFVMYEACGACQVDHICPLACCGLDAPQNMQWMSKKDNLAKGADCSACAPALPTPIVPAPTPAVPK
jgi:hypothetical protein